MTESEAKDLIAGLTEEEKLILFELLLSLQQNPSPAEHPAPAD